MVSSQEKRPTQLSEVDFGDRKKWVFGYIAQIEVSEMFNNLATAAQSIQGRLDNLNQDVLGVADLARSSTKRLKQNPFSNPAEDTDKIVGSGLTIFGKADILASDARSYISQRDTISRRNTRVFKLINEREQALGDQMRDIPPAPYVTRAIGQNHPVIDRRWTQVRAEIELFRHFTGETDPEITLGQSCNEEWAVYARKAFIFNIGHIQVAQVMLEPDCNQAAANMGIGQLLDVCGKPPLLSEEEVGRQLKQVPTDTWMRTAQIAIRDIERPYL